MEPLDYLAPVVSTSTYLSQRPADEHARRRRDETVRRALRAHPVAAVAEAASLSPRAVADIVLGPQAASRADPQPPTVRSSPPWRLGFVPRRSGGPAV